MTDAMTKRQVIVDAFSPEPELPFSNAEFRQRLENVRREMARQKIDLLYLTSPESIYYLSGYRALWYQAQSLAHWEALTGVAVHVDHDHIVMFETDAEDTLCKYTVISCDIRIADRHVSSLSDFIVSELEAKGWLGGNTGLEMRSYRPNRIVSETLQRKFEKTGCTVSDGTEILTRVRHIKSPQELAYIRKAARFSDIGLEAARNTIRAGVTELEVWGEVMAAISKAGGENPSITLPVHSGPKTMVPHSLPSRRVMMPGDLVNVDVCAVYNRYHSDCSRTFSIGEADPEVIDTIAKSARSFDILAEVGRPGIAVAEVTAALRNYYEETGLWGAQWWTGGYELGCSFPPDWVGSFSYDVELDPGDAAFLNNTVVNYESDFYLPRGAGMSLLIDTMIFGDGGLELLHKTQRDLIIVE